MRDAFEIDNDGPDGLTLRFDSLELPVRLDYDGTLSIVLRTTNEQWRFFELLDEQLGDWYREGCAVRAEFQRGVPERDVAGERDALDPLDPKHPDYADNLADLGDIRRTRARESGDIA